MSLETRRVVVGKDEYRVEVILHAERRKHVSVVNLSPQEQEKQLQKVAIKLGVEIITEIKEKHNLTEVRKIASTEGKLREQPKVPGTSDT